MCTTHTRPLSSQALKMHLGRAAAAPAPAARGLARRVGVRAGHVGVGLVVCVERAPLILLACGAREGKWK